MKPFVYNPLWKSSLYFLSVGCGLFLTARASSQFSSASTGLAPASVLYSLPLTIRNKPCLGFVDTTCSCQEGGKGIFLPMAQKHEWVTMTCPVGKGNKLNIVTIVCGEFVQWAEGERAVRTQSSGQRSWRLSWVLWNLTLIFSILKRKNEMTFRCRKLC